MLLQKNTSRLLSLDFMRGLIMVLLMLEAAGLYERLFEISEETLLQPFITRGMDFGFGI